MFPVISKTETGPYEGRKDEERSGQRQSVLLTAGGEGPPKAIVLKVCLEGWIGL